MRRSTITAVLLSAATVLATAVPRDSWAEVRLPRLVSDGVVLQREQAATLWGWADPGETVEVLLDQESVARVDAVDGRWSVALPPQTAGGPHVLDFVGENRVTVRDVYFGDVWIASGQSNMELPMERVKEKFSAEIAAADYPLIRQFEVPRAYDFESPRADLDGGEWKAANPESVLEFSAVGYFFARELHQQYDVPVGIISSNYGGSAAESWMSEEALASYPHYLDIALRYREPGYLDDLIEADEARDADWYAALDAADEGLNGEMPWYEQGFNDLAWQVMEVPGYWADTPLGDVHGVVWFRREFDLPAELAGLPAKLMLGRIVDADTTWINGHEAGNVTYQYPPRRYDIDAGILEEGGNVITVRVVNSAGRGGFVDDKPYWIRVGDTTIDLSGEWRLHVGAQAPALAGPAFTSYKQPLSFYNAMLAPLLPMTIKGVIWYQGETNTGRPLEYRNLFRAMIRNWRADFGQGNFPFLFVQLANFMEAHAEPTESDWAETREAQRLALAEPNTAMAVTIDVGEWNDIHPLDKKTVGERLALAARAVAYGERDVVYSGPVPESVTRRDGTLVVEFDPIGSGLSVDGDAPAGFAIAGADGRFVWADAEIKGRKVVLQSPAVPVPEYVRYAWADNPDTANLYNEEGLPASPFEARAGVPVQQTD